MKRRALDLRTGRFSLRYSRAFTLVELMVIIVIIAILSSVVYASYLGVRDAAEEGAVQTDLSTGATGIEVNKGKTQQYPADYYAAAADIGLTSSPGNMYQYSPLATGAGFCLSSSRANGVKPFHFDSTTGVVTEGYCFGHSGTIVTTLAGMGSRDYHLDGTGLAAKMYDTWSVAASPDGQYIYANDWPCIRRITPQGVMTTLAGDCGPSGYNSGFNDATGTAALFSNPYSMAVASNGNIFVADGGNNRIRQVTPAGVVTTFAGSGVDGYGNGNGLSATFTYPDWITIDSSDNLYVLDNFCIRKITPAAVVTTITGTCGSSSGMVDGDSSTARLYFTNGITMGLDGNIYFTDMDTIRMSTPTGTVTTVAGGGTGSPNIDGIGTAALMSPMLGMCTAPNGMIYFSDWPSLGNGFTFYGIRSFNPTTLEVKTLAGVVTNDYAYTHYDGMGGNAKFEYPSGCAVAPDGTIYMADEEGSHIRKIVVQ